MNYPRVPRLLLICLSLMIAVGLVGCGGGGATGPGDGTNDPGPGPGGSLALSIQGVDADADAAGLAVSFASGIPQGSRLTFVGDRVRLVGEGFTAQTRVFLGMNNAIARRENSLLTTEAADLPTEAFVYVDPENESDRTILEVEAKVELVSSTEIDLIIPAAVSCSPDFSPAGGPVIRAADTSGSAKPVTDALFIVGPRGLAADPSRGPQSGGNAVTLYGDFFSDYTQIAIRYADPVTGSIRILGDGDTANGSLGGRDDLEEQRLDRNTLVIVDWPTPGIPTTAELDVDILFFENIDALAELDPSLDSACDPLTPAGEVSLNPNGSRNFEMLRGYTYLPAVLSARPQIDSVTPREGSVVGGETIVVRGRFFDAHTVDLSDPNDPGIRIECPSGSGLRVAPRSAMLVDGHTLLVEMPPCPFNIETAASLELRNRYSLDSTGGGDAAYVRAESVYTYHPLPSVLEPELIRVVGEPNDAGCQRVVILGQRFDAVTAEAGGVEIDAQGETLEATRVVLHDESTLEIFLPRLPTPLEEDLAVTLRLRNAAGTAEFADAIVLRATPDAGVTPTLSELEPEGGAVGGGNVILVRGSDFDTNTEVRFGATASPSVRFVNAGLLLATVPPAGQAGSVDVTVVDGTDESAPLSYEYGAPSRGPQVAAVDVASGPNTGGYALILRGTGFTAATRVEFGAGSDNYSDRVTFVDDSCLRVVAPSALASQEGATVNLRAVDPLMGAGPAGVGFDYVASDVPSITDVVTSIETLAPSLYLHGWDRALVEGSGFDSETAFEIVKAESKFGVVVVRLLGPGLAALVMPSVTGDPETASLIASGTAGSSTAFEVEYLAVPVPVIDDVRTLVDEGTTATEGERLVLFGDFYFDDGTQPLTVRLTGQSAGSDESTTVALSGADLVLLGDAEIALRVPVGVFAPGPLGIEVVTRSGTAAFEDEGGDPVFSLGAAKAPRIDAVSPELFSSSGGAFAVFSGRFLTTTTDLQVRSTAIDAFQPVRGLRIVSDTVATGYMPSMPGGMPPAGIAGIVRAEEMDAARAAAIDGDPFTVSDAANPLFRVLDDSSPALLALIPDRGSIDGGELVLLLGDGFLGADNQPNVDRVVFRHPDLGPVEYERVSSAEAPLTALPGGINNGKFLVVNDTTIVLVTTSRPPILVGDALPVDVEVHGVPGNSLLLGAYVYENTPAVRTPYVSGITPNEVRLNGGSSHLISGGFLTEVDRIVLTATGKEARVEIARADFAEVSDFFLVFEMPDLRDYFEVGDLLTLRAEKDVDGNPERLISNGLTESLRVTFAGPPAIEVEDGVDPASGSSFGGDVVVLRGSLFTANSQVLFGTYRAPVVVAEDETTLHIVLPGLPIDAPGDGLDLLNLTDEGRDRTVDVAVFTQGGWAVLEDAFTFEPEAPEITGMSPSRAIEGSTTRITLRGERFLPDVQVTPLLDGEESPQAGSVSNVTFVSLEEIRFDYTAPVPAENTLGPLEITFRVETSHGSDLSPVFYVELSPFVTSVKRLDREGDPTVPTTGLEDGKRIILELEGGNFAEGASLAVVNRQGTKLPLTEVSTLSGGAQFVVVSRTVMRLTVPFAFGNDTPTLIEGNPNVGPADLEFRNANTLGAEVTAAFTYVPSVFDFDSFSFRIPTGVPVDAVPHELTLGDINADGLTDAAMMVRAASPEASDPEVYVFLADTFGDEDVNGDGIVPDFAGSFTKYVIADDTVRTEAGFLGRGGTVVLGNFDGDDQLELAVPTRVESNTNAVRVLLADYDAAKDEFVTKGLLTADGAKSDAVGGIAVGDFDGDHAGDDLALIVEDIAKTKRRLTIFQSTGSFTFDQFSVQLPTDSSGGRVGFLAAGNFDGKGRDELIWAHSDWSTGLKPQAYPVAVATIDDSTESVTIKALTNFTGGEIHDIEIFDHDGDGADSAALIVQNAATLDGQTRPGGIAILLKPLSLKVGSYIETAFKSNGRALGHGDLDADGQVDLVAANTLGEFFILIGKPDGSFEDASGSWFLPTIPESFDTRIENIGIADLNNDGLGEIWIGDIGSAPTSLQIFLNESR